jgi:hypothetical protein
MINFYGSRHAQSSASATDIGLSNYPDWLEPAEPEWVMGPTNDFEKFATVGNQLPIVGFRVQKSAMVGNFSTRYRP